MNETLKVLKERRSCRKFKEDMITNEELENVLEAGTYAPTGNGKQSPIIIAITNKKIRDELSLENRKVGNMPEGFDPFYNAPVILAVLADKSVKTYLYDGSLVMGNMLNACESLGLGSIWIHRAKEVFEKEFGKNLLKGLNIIGDYGFDASQVTIGGVNIEEITEKFELKKMINTYAIGELLDVDGLCGGYNIHFAIASGVMVANSIYEKEMGKNEKEK